MKRDKLNAYHDFVSIIRQSWTYEKLSPTERKRVEYAMSDANDRYGRGDYITRYSMLHATYEGFLAALGYDDGDALGTGWKPWRS